MAGGLPSDGVAVGWGVGVAETTGWDGWDGLSLPQATRRRGRTRIDPINATRRNFMLLAASEKRRF